MGISAQAIGIWKSVVLLAAVAFCASSAMAQQYTVPDCVHEQFFPSHRTYQEVAADSVFATQGQLVLQGKEIERDGSLNSTLKPAYLVVAQWPKPGAKLNAGDTVDIIVIDNNEIIDDFKKIFILSVAVALAVGLVAGWCLCKLKKA